MLESLGAEAFTVDASGSLFLAAGCVTWDCRCEKLVCALFICPMSTLLGLTGFEQSARPEGAPLVVAWGVLFPTVVSSSTTSRYQRSLMVTRSSSSSSPFSPFLPSPSPTPSSPSPLLPSCSCTGLSVFTWHLPTMAWEGSPCVGRADVEVDGGSCGENVAGLRTTVPIFPTTWTFPSRFLCPSVCCNIPAPRSPSNLSKLSTKRSPAHKLRGDSCLPTLLTACDLPPRLSPRSPSGVPPPPPGSCFLGAPPLPPPPNFSADCTLFRRGERGGSALLGRGRETGGEGCNFGGKLCVVRLLPTL